MRDFGPQTIICYAVGSLMLAAAMVAMMDDEARKARFQDHRNEQITQRRG